MLLSYFPRTGIVASLAMAAMDSFDFLLDPIDGLRALCKAFSVPDDLMTHLTSAGFTTVALLGQSISDVQEILVACTNF